MIESRTGGLNRNNVLELPKINRTVGSDTYSGSSSWIKHHGNISEGDYDYISTIEIQREYNQLRKELLIFNDRVAKKVDHLKTSGVKNSHHFNKNKQEILEEEIKNNMIIRNNLNQELAGLEERASTLTHDRKNQVEDQIQATKISVSSIKLQIKTLGALNQQIGCKIANYHEIFQEIKFLQKQDKIIFRKRDKLINRTKQIRKQKKELENKNLQNENSLVFQYMDGQESFQDKFGVNIELDKAFKYKQHQVKTLTWNIRSINQKNALAYQRSLKKLAEQRQKIGKIDLQIESKGVDIHSIHSLLEETQQKAIQSKVKADKRQDIPNNSVDIQLPARSNPSKTNAVQTNGWKAKKRVNQEDKHLGRYEQGVKPSGKHSLYQPEKSTLNSTSFRKSYKTPPLQKKKELATISVVETNRTKNNSQEPVFQPKAKNSFTFESPVVKEITDKKIADNYSKQKPEQKDTPNVATVKIVEEKQKEMFIEKEKITDQKKVEEGKDKVKEVLVEQVQKKEELELSQSDSEYEEDGESDFDMKIQAQKSNIREGNSIKIELQDFGKNLKTPTKQRAEESASKREQTF